MEYTIKGLKSSVLRALNPGYSYCRGCGVPWNHCKSRVVMTSNNSGTFATCDECWERSTLKELKEYYSEVYNTQKASAPGYDMDHTVEHLINCVERDYYEELEKYGVLLRENNPLPVKGFAGTYTPTKQIEP